MSFTAADFQPRDDDTWDLPPPVADPNDPLRVKAYQPQPDAKPSNPATTAQMIGVWPPPGNTPGPMVAPNVQTSVRPDGTVVPYKPPEDIRLARATTDPQTTQTALAIPRVQTSPPPSSDAPGTDRQMVPWERASQIIQTEESGGKNVWNYRHAERPDYFTAGGPWQMVDGTWKEGAQLAGFDASQWQHAIDAPRDLQERAAHAIYDKYGYKPWQKSAGGALPDGAPAANAGALGIGPAYERARVLAGQMMPPASGYDPASLIPEFRRINQQQIEAERPLIEARQRLQAREEADADEKYQKLQRDEDDPALKPWTMKPPQPDPIGGLASLGSIFAALAAGFSHTPAIAAMNGMAAAIDARNEGNQKQYDEAFTAYKYNSELALRRTEIMQKEYDAAWARVRENPELGLAELRAVSQIYQDEKSEVLIESGQLEKADEIYRARQDAQQKLTEKLLELDPELKFGPSQNTPLARAIWAKQQEYMGPPNNMEPNAAYLKAYEYVSKTIKPQSAAQTQQTQADLLAADKWQRDHNGAQPTDEDKKTPEYIRDQNAALNSLKKPTAADTKDAQAAVLAIDKWKQDHNGVEPTEDEKQSAEFVRDKMQASVKQPNLNPKEQDVQTLARAEFNRLHGHYPTNSDADSQEMAALRTSQRQAAQGVVDDKTAEFIAGEVLSGNKEATVGLARNSANIAKVGAALTRLAAEKGVTPGELSVRFAEFTGLMQAERTLGARTANMEVPANEVNFMGNLAVKASEKVSRTDYPNINDVIIAMQQGTGNVDVVDFGQATYSLVISYAKFLNPTGVPTDADKANATRILQMGWSHDQFAEAIRFMKKEIESGQQGVAATRFELPDLVLPSVRGRTPQPAAAPQAPDATPAPAGGVDPPTVDLKGYDALPSGAHYRTPGDPTIREKP